jgi:cytochrome c5
MPPEAIRLVVRRGLGAMPAMSRAEVSDSELEAIIAHLSSASGSPR